MLTAEQKDLLKTLHRNLTDRALGPDDKNYVPVFKNHDVMTEDPISDIATNINFSDLASINLLTGPRGSGKTTELKRLTQILIDDDCVVFHCDMSHYMNLTTTVDITDFLISVMNALNDAVTDKYGKDFSERSYTERLTEFLNKEIELKDASFKANIGSIKAALKDDPSFKLKLQQSLRGYVSQVVQQAHQFAATIVKFVQQKHPNKKVVLLIDSVEQIRGVGEDAQLVYQSVENLFSSHADNLKIPTLHTVYTIPPYMSALAPGVARILGGNAVQTLPSIHVRTQDNQDDKKGLDIMYHILLKRSDQLSQILTREQVDQLAKLSGGDLRNFFRFVRQCLVKAGSNPEHSLPIIQPILTQAINQFRREMLIPKDDLVWLKKINKSSNHELSNQDALAQFARFLDSGLVLNYRNGDDWYGVNPLLQELLEQESDVQPS